MAPNTDDNEWERALWGEDHAWLQVLIKRQAPTDALHKLERHIRQLYMLSELQPESIDRDRAARRIDQLSAFLPELRRQIGGWSEQQAHDLRTLQWIRRNSALSVVLGAGATIAAGGPSWPTLVKKLLLIAVNKGREIYGTMVRVDRVKRLTTKAEMEARQILNKIEAGSTDTELLKRGAQLCADLFEESLFQHITAILYPGAKREPSRIHRSIARLAARRCGPRPGLVSVINYNFDSLMNEALEEEGISYTCQFMANRKIEQFAPKKDTSPNQSMPVIHLHGFTPRRTLFDISGLDFVFSTQQFDEVYSDVEETIINYAV
jgi:SIR2-like protein